MEKKEVAMTNQEELQYLLNQLGDFGKYQIFQHFLHCLIWLVSAVHMMGFVFVFPAMEHRCYLEGVDGNWSAISEIGNRIPITEEGKPISCEKFQQLPNESNVTRSCGEDGFVYNSSYYEASRVIEWDMVCENEWMRAMLHSIFIFGSLLGSFAGGALADKIGRKPVICFSGIVQFFWGIGVVFLDNFYVVAVSMLMYGLFGSGTANGPAVALTMEIVGSSKRTLCGTMISFSFGLGAVLVPIWAYYFSGDARILQLIYVSHSLLLFANWWLVDESICWLWSQGKKDEAMVLLGKAAKMNGVDLSYPEGLRRPSTLSKRRSTLAEVLLKRRNRPDAVSFLDLFRTPEIRKRLLVSLYLWLAGGMIYYGLSFNSVSLFGNPYLIFILVCVAEFPSHPITIWLSPRIGYKPMVLVNLLIPSVASVVLAFLPKNAITTGAAMLAKICSTIVMNVINAYSSELFPTVLRNTALGICLVGSRFGATVIPAINLLSSYAESLPGLVHGMSGIIGCVLVFLFLPETMNTQIPQTVKDVEEAAAKKKKEKEKEKDGNNYHNNPAFELCE
ncbi:unnamed protein product [Orchesella dallaii]|uniref:Major facilitator superfamily (MFS) profile domain-containing protein n=1 Tax=Orchesella dallaii TaxID=48710 RepID=A0ABP1Q1K2_9HEXA